MSQLYMMVTITDRNNGKRFMSLYQEKDMEVMFIMLGRGTAGSEVLDYFGLEEEEKVVIITFVTDATWHTVKKMLQTQLKIDVPGTGIVFLIPASSIGGSKALQFLVQPQEFEKREESVLKETAYELLVVVADYGYIELIMEAAREAGAGGGTVLHAKGAGMERAEQFLGISLASEKQMILIVAKSENKNAIMKAVMDKAGLESKAKSIIFSLPVTSTAGLRLMEPEE